MIRNEAPTRGVLTLWVLLAVVPALAPAPDDRAVIVEPGDLARRPELVGREVVVDDRIRYFLESRRGQGFDQLVLKRTDVSVFLPTGLRPARPPSEPNAVVRGTLRQVDGRLSVEATTLELVPADGDRLDRELGRLRPDDFAGRRTWALWAERRGRELNEPKLVERGIAAEVEALWAEANRPGVDTLALADGIADRPIPRMIRDALYHRGFRAAAVQARTLAEVDALMRRVGLALPRAATPAARGGGSPTPVGVDPADPAATYRATATDDDRAQLDRQLYADLFARSLDLRLRANPTQAAALADEATRTLPDRPVVAADLRRIGLAEAEKGVASLRQAQVEELAKTFRSNGEQDRARRLLEDWLTDRRKHRLSDTDAEGRILLAANYEKLLGDRATAGQLLGEAQAIEPGSRAVADAYLRLGYRKGENGWHDPLASTPVTGNAEAAPILPPAAAGDRGDSLRGLTQSQVRARMGGKPDRIVRSATQAIITEQWIYRSDRSEQIILFQIEPSTTEPRASASYAVAR